MDSSDRMNRDLYGHIRGLMDQSVLPHRSGGEFYTAYPGGTMFDWDSYFDGITALYMGYGTRFLQTFVRVFLRNQREDGFICRFDRETPETLYPQMYGEHIKPFLAQAALLCWLYDGRLDWFTDELYDRMRRYLLYWTEVESVNGDAYYRSGPHSGMDTQTERCGGWEADFDGAADLGSFLYRDLCAFVQLAELRGREEDAERFEQLAAGRKARVLSMWDEADGFFYDRNVRTGEPIRVKTAAGFMPLWAGIATPRQAQILAFDHMFNPSEFFRPYPLSVMAADEPGYSAQPLPGDIGVCNWRANVWMPVNYMCMHGLMNYGYDGLAELLAYKTAELLTRSRDREFYDAETGRGMGLKPFAGWSLLGYFMPMEASEGFDPTALDLLPEDMEAYMPFFRLPPAIEL